MVLELKNNCHYKHPDRKQPVAIQLQLNLGASEVDLVAEGEGWPMVRVSARKFACRIS